MLLTPARVSAGRFRYDAAAKTFTAERSDLGPDFRLGRVFDDACDAGFTLVSHRTGREVVMAADGCEFDDEGDLLSERFVSLGRNGHPDGRYEAVLFND